MKFYNAQNGFAAGDELIKAFAETLKDEFGSECCCHAGGDHFAAFAAEEGLEEKLRRFLADCRHVNGGNTLPVHIGIYPNSLDNVPPITAYDRAKFACDLLRDTYGSSYGYFDRNLRDEAERRRHVLANLERAIDEGWIHVHYQPIVRAVNGRVCDEEALSRWFDPELGMLSPDEFIPALEQSGVIYKLDLHVLEQVLDKMNQQRAQGLDLVPHSLNLSRTDFVACDIVEEIRKRVDAAGIDRDMITIEITESTIGHDLDFMRQQIGRFRELGFPVWMDDFGSGYSSLDLLQSMEFDLIKFDMSFMRRLNESESSKIVLTELMKMATALGLETVCEGVETPEQVAFLQEIGCSKLQGYYFCKPISFESLLERYETGNQIGYEHLAESPFYDAISRVNLYDLAIVAHEDDDGFLNYFDTLPVCIAEVGDGEIDLVRASGSYHDFITRFFDYDLKQGTRVDLGKYFSAKSTLMRVLQDCRSTGSRSFFDQAMRDGSIVHSFARHIATNPITGKSAIALAVLSITEPNEGATYASIARALAADYYNIYYVDLDTEKFIEYTSPVGEEELAMERHGEDFFEASRRATETRIYEGDREVFLAAFTRENVLKALDVQNAFALTYRLIDTGEPMYVNMKITRLYPGANQIIVGVGIVDSQMRQREYANRIRRERDMMARMMALSGNYLSLYSIEPRTGRYFEYSASSEYETLGLAKEGEDFFKKAALDAEQAIHPDDLPRYLEVCTEENVMREIRDHGAFTTRYRLMLPEGPTPVSLRIARVQESSGERLVAGVRLWVERQPT